MSVGFVVMLPALSRASPLPQFESGFSSWNAINTVGAGLLAKAIRQAPGLPKTRSGKIMRRILRKIATAEYDGLGDISTLADPGVVQHLIDTHKTMNVA
jgi:acetyl-CoA synthetase